MRTYRHYRRSVARGPLLLLGVAALAAAGALAWSATTPPSREGLPWPVFLALLLVLLINLVILGDAAVEIRLSDDGPLELVAPFRTARVSVHAIVSIKPSKLMNGALYVLEHRDGSVRFDPRLDGMHELVAELKRRNPAIVLRGL